METKANNDFCKVEIKWINCEDIKMLVDPLLSVIVPVYNAENTLKKCLDSIKKQIYKKYEVILIDDGSKDKSGQICDYY